MADGSSDASKLHTLFNKIRAYGFTVRQNELHGLKAWKPIKDILISHQSEGIWSIEVKIDNVSNEDIDSIYCYVRDTLGMKGGDFDTSDPNWEPYHFFLQLIRIPRNSPKCSILRICQIAYNIGQLTSELKKDADKKIYDDKARQYYEINNLHKLESYVNAETIKIFDSQIDDSILDKIDEAIDSQFNLTGGSNLSHTYTHNKKAWFILTRDGY